MAIRQSPKLQTSHTRFILVFATLLYGVCNAINIEKLTRWFQDKNGIDYLPLVAYLGAGLCLFIAFLTLIAHRRTVKPVAILLIVASAVATYFISKYNVAIDSSMIQNTIHTDPTEVGQLLSMQMIPYAVFLVACPVLVVLFAIDVTFEATPTYLLSSLKLFIATLAIAVVALYANYNAIHRAGNVSNKYIVYSLVPINVLSGSISVVSKSVSPYLKRDETKIEITGRLNAKEDLIVVLAIGETSRRRNFSVYGYDRVNTNPVLEKISGLHFLNGIARRGTTLDALPEILEKEGVKLPLLVSKLGVSAACFVNYTLYDNCAAIGETTVSNCRHGGHCYDEDVIPLLEERLKQYSSGPSFVVLHLGGGSHGPTYSDRYPAEYQRFKPLCNDADVANQCTLEELYNSYDNTILYVDYVLGDIIKTLDHSGHRYVFIYLSDHGESLLEEGRMFHGMPPGVKLPPEQAEIPLIVKSSIPVSVDKRTAYTQQDVFDTILTLFSIETPLFETPGSFIQKQVESTGSMP